MPRQSLALALCRVSSREQLENNSLNRQRDAVLRAAEELNLTIDEWWSGSVSSKKGTNVDRKDLQEMLARCKKDNRIKYVIVDEVDRFMRSMLEIGYFLVEFKKLGVQVIFASQPDLKTNTATDTLMLMLEAFKAEGSNEERQRKSISGQTKALNEGRYTFHPKPGYRRGYERGIHEIDPSRGPALQRVLTLLAAHELTPTQALAELNRSDFRPLNRALYKMDKFRRIATDPYYAGIVEINKQVNVRNENGLHKALITPAQHTTIIDIFTAKKKNQTGPRKGGNPKYPGNNIIHCDLCKEARNGRYVGFNHSNGQNADLVYEKYRCRSCKRYMTRQEVHSGIELCLKRKPTKEGTEDLIEALNIVWKQREGRATQDAARIRRKLSSMDAAISNQVDAAIDPGNASIKAEILASIDKRKLERAKVQEELDALVDIADADKDDFIRFALEFAANVGERFLDPDLSQAQRLECKQIIFPAGFHIDENKKVYTPEISPLYRLATNKKDAEASELTHLVRVRRL